MCDVYGVVCDVKGVMVWRGHTDQAMMARGWEGREVTGRSLAAARVVTYLTGKS